MPSMFNPMSNNTNPSFSSVNMKMGMISTNMGTSLGSNEGLMTRIIVDNNGKY